jgi:hypothetical protein
MDFGTHSSFKCLYEVSNKKIRNKRLLKGENLDDVDKNYKLQNTLQKSL